MKNIIKNLVVFCLSVAFCLALGEIFIKVFYKHFADYNMEMWRYSKELKQPLPLRNLPFYHYPNREGDYYGVHIKINSLGIRDYEYAIEKPKGKKRIIFLGDSFTLGWGVPFEKTYPKQLEGFLNRQGSFFEVLNMGVGNYNSIMQVELFKLKGIKLNPDMVVLMYFINDAEPVPRQPKFLEYYLRKNSYLFALLFDKYAQFMPRFSSSLNWKQYYSNLYLEGSNNLIANRYALIELFEICKKQKIKLLIVNIPELRMLKDCPFNFATEYISNLAKAYNIAFLDLLPALVHYDPHSLWISNEDLHANTKVNSIIAREIYRKIIKERLILASH